MDGKAIGSGHGKPGRPNTLYFDLLEQVKRDWAAGTWISIRSFANPTSAFVSKRAIEGGKRPVPGGVREWEFSAHKEDIEDVDGQRIPGSVLYARWLGPPVEIEAPRWEPASG